MKKFLEHKVINSLAIVTLLLFFFGVLDNIYTFPMTKINDKSIEYLDDAINKSKNLVISLSATKGILDVIEGSTTGVNLVVQGELETGDAVSPLLDVVNTMWKASIIGAVAISVEKILLKFISPNYFSYLMALSSLLWIIAQFIKSGFLRSILRLSLIFTFVIFLGFPILLNVSANFSRQLTDYKSEIIHEMKSINEKTGVNTLSKESVEVKKEEEKNSIRDKISGIFKSEGSRTGEIETEGKKIFNLGDRLKEYSSNIYEFAITLIAITFLDAVFIPLSLVLILYFFVKNLFAKLLI